MAGNGEGGFALTVYDGEGPACLLLHPLGLCGDFWAAVRNHLAGRRIAVAELPGHGCDDGLGELSLDSLADDLVASARHFGGRMVLIGCSLGGILAQAAAIRAPEVVGGLVLANTLCRGDNPKVIDARADLAETDFAAYLNDTLDRWFDAEFRAANPAGVTQVRRWLEGTAPRVHARYWRAIRSFDLTGGLGKLDCPALVVAGSHDRSTPPAAAQELAAALPDVTVAVLEGVGHLAPFEQPPAFAALVARHLGRVAAPPDRHCMAGDRQ